MAKVLTLGGLKSSDFQKAIDGKAVNLFILTNQNGLEMAVTNYGAKIVSLHVLDKGGKAVDVVLGHNNIEEYMASAEPYFGAVCGRVGNRIAKGLFTLDGKSYKLAVNNGPNHLHGGLKGFNAVVWDAVQTNHQTLKLTYISPDSEEGYPGTLTVKVVYTLTDDNTVQIGYTATTDKPTILNLTNHSYFNLSGAGDAYIGDHLLTINADAYLPTDDTNIPYGDAEPVAGTPMDFRTPHTIGARINDDFEQLRFGKGYDHTYVLNKQGQELSLCAKAVSPKTGIAMDTFTTEPGVQLYTGNWMTGEFAAKYGKRYPERSAFCLETQHFPDSINHPAYPPVVLRPGETFQSKTFYKFYHQ
ncbi:MAG: galactose mutarotase [Bacteroidales bacterium]|jgi:aldose 1-epimerase|nr:galactose mutarotase [Bacteroidales bacterium]